MGGGGGDGEGGSEDTRSFTAQRRVPDKTPKRRKCDAFIVLTFG